MNPIDDFDFDLDLYGGNADFDVDINLGDFGTIIDDDNLKSRYIKPPIKKCAAVKYEHAARLALEIGLGKGERTFAIVSGKFIFGDLIEGILAMRDLHADEIYVATLSMSQENVDSFVNIMEDGRCDSLNLLISAYFFSHERNNLIPYIYQELDKGNRFQMAVTGIHCKIALIRCQDRFYVLHGSANLRSSNNIEQFEFEESEELYNFNKAYFDEIIDRYKTIRKIKRGDELWQVVAQAEAAEAVRPEAAARRSRGEGTRR